MPIFHRDSIASSSSSGHSIDEPHQAHRSNSLFGGRSTHSEHSSRSSRSSRSSNSGAAHHSRRHHSLFQRSPEDPSIQAAREQVFRAETAEREADKALMASKLAVKEARDHVKSIEREAAEEARMAKIKQDQAKSISKRAKPLGRHH
ncbi:hypothetical protein N7509_000557 [Penicillium cosmopolitanum]|uniref:Uncharacterized protein n=1 Tax=Penicillium cosmopolitanum TaxID=1131564 RepID=A0A9X0BEA6_9EURO|nr:uncharacterized protein N7509_000557 [Penicillium cosmopolitanum]KAJ5413930.1 hypothetical protein N7509_000557 [Penicillium cosmopolitanum]